MITEAIIDVCLAPSNFILNIIPNIPPMPIGLSNSINNVLDTIFGHLDLLGLFIRIDTIKILIPILLALFNFSWIYHLVLWIIHKIPVSMD